VKRPIVVTGSHRSGTTWTGRMLALASGVGYMHEPLNPARLPSWSDPPTRYWYVYVTRQNEHLYRPTFERFLTFRYPYAKNLRHLKGAKAAGRYAQDALAAARYRLAQPRPLVKDPFVLFSTPWIADRFDAQIVVMIRHPAAFASSLKKLNWQFKFKTVLQQDLLLRDHLEPWVDEMTWQRDNDVDIVDQAILLWNVLHDHIRKLRASHDDWFFVRHEDLAADPLAGFAALYRGLGLELGERQRDAIAAHSTGENVKDVPTWRHGSVKRDSRAATKTWLQRLSPEEIARIRRGTDPIALDFYDDADWAA